jgi:hypothetical protein
MTATPSIDLPSWMTEQHARPARISVMLTEELILVEVIDNGRGIGNPAVSLTCAVAPKPRGTLTISTPTVEWRT